MRVIPLTGQVLIELDPTEQFTAGGIQIPNHTLSPEEKQQASRDPIKPAAITGRVVEIGQWPKLRNGLAVMPEFSRGARVAIRPGAGVAMQWETSGRLKMVRVSDVMAVLT